MTLVLVEMLMPGETTSGMPEVAMSGRAERSAKKIIGKCILYLVPLY